MTDCEDGPEHDDRDGETVDTKENVAASLRALADRIEAVKPW